MLPLIRRWVALAHLVKNKIEAAYGRPALFEWRQLMEDSSSYLPGETLRLPGGRS